MRKISSYFASALCLTLIVVGAAAVQSQEDTGRLLKQLEDDTDNFRASLDKALDESRFNGTSTEDELNVYVKQFEDSTDRLKENYEAGRDTRFAANEVLSRGKRIDSFLRKNKLNSMVQTDWRTVRTDLGRLARVHRIKMGW